MKNKPLLQLISLVVLLCGSLQSAPAESRVPLSFGKIENIRAGKTTVDEVRTVLGEPDRQTSIESSGLEKMLWLYLEGEPSGTRLSLRFDSKSRIVSSMVWFPEDHEPESQLKAAIAHFKSAHFKQREAEWTNPHASPDEIFFEDQAKGLKITYLKTPGYVESISWQAPTPISAKRTPTVEKQKNKFQIGGQPE